MNKEVAPPPAQAERMPLKGTRTEPEQAQRGKVELQYRLAAEEKASRRPAAGSLSCVERQRAPRLARLLALAIRCDDLLRRGVVRDYAALAGLAGISRSRMTQIMHLHLLAPDIQEEILFVPERARLKEKQLRALCGIVNWNEQRQHWLVLREKAGERADPLQ